MSNVSEKRQANLDAIRAAINKKFGDNSIMKMGEQPPQVVDSISTGSLELDIATGIGGFPRGRISEIYAQESGGKTTTTLHAIANCQRAGGTAAFIDAEHALDIEYARTIGVNVEELLLSQPDTGEEGLEIVEMLVSSGAVDMIIVDSVSALTPRAEIDGEMGDAHVALQARLMSQALRKVNSAVAKTNTALIFINQLRDKIGTMGYGDPTTTTGGKALKFYASLRVKLTRAGSRKEKDEAVSNKVKFKIDKNKLAAPFKVGEFEIMFNGRGIDRNAQVLTLGEAYKITYRSGAYYGYFDEDGEKVTIGQGFGKALEFLEDNPVFANKLWNRVSELHYAKIGRDNKNVLMPETIEEAFASDDVSEEEDSDKK